MEIRQQLQSLALKLNGYSSKASISTASETQIEHLDLRSNSPVEWNDERLSPKIS